MISGVNDRSGLWLMARRGLAASGALLILMLPVLPAPARDTSSAPGAWRKLFDGRSIESWVRRGGSATYRVEKGSLVGRTAEGSPNTFLCPPEDFDNFELEFEVLVDGRLNSGVQIRSRSVPEWHNGQVHGPQIEIAIDGSAGFVYGEGLDTGWLEPPTDAARKATPFRDGAWNKYRVVASGPAIRTWINGRQVADYRDLTTGMRRGFIGFQVHGIPRGTGPYEVRWRNIRIRSLPASE